MLQQTADEIIARIDELMLGGVTDEEAIEIQRLAKEAVEASASSGWDWIQYSLLAFIILGFIGMVLFLVWPNKKPDAQ